MKKPSFLTPPRSLKPLSPKDALDLDSLIRGCAYLQRIDYPEFLRLFSAHSFQVWRNPYGYDEPPETIREAVELLIVFVGMRSRERKIDSERFLLRIHGHFAQMFVFLSLREQFADDAQ
jgi:hypothetical protein